MPHQAPSSALFGRLSLEAFPIHEPILLWTFIVVVALGLGVVAAVTRFKLWGYLWREWLTTVDHKKIGIMYMILGIIMLLRGFADALMMRLQQAIAFGGAEGYLNAHHYDQIFTAHGTIMIFFVAIPLVVGLVNYVMPLQIGARDVAFPFLNSLSFWLTVAGAVLVMISLFVGEFSTAGWLNYVPVANIENSPGTGPDYYLWALQIAGVGTTLSAINMVTTIIKMRAPGMTLMKMPVFCWTALCSNVLAIAIFPVLTGAFALLMLDRYVGTNFFTNDLGGNADDVLEPGVDLGPSRGLCPRPAGVRHLFGDHLDLHRQAPVRLFLDGLRHRGHHDPELPRLAPPLLHDGLGRQRQLASSASPPWSSRSRPARRSSTGCSPCTAGASASSCR